MANLSNNTTSTAMQINIKSIFNQFLTEVGKSTIEIYNEFSLQHELGIYLRNKLSSTNYKVQFERNISYFGRISNPIKKEMDICVFNVDGKGNPKDRLCAIELKFPRNGQHPEQMYSFVKDIAFMEQVHNQLGFLHTFTLTIVEDRLFFDGKEKTGIYSYFRGSKPISGNINKPTGQNKNDYVFVLGNYSINWKSNTKKYHYYIVAIS